MAKKKKEKDFLDEITKSVDPAAVDAALEKRVESRAAAKIVPVPEPVMTFDRWFAHTGKPAHHKPGMKAYLNRKLGRGKRTVAAWNALYAKY